MKEEEFKAHMGYVDGKTDADLLMESELEELEQAQEKLHVLKVRFSLASQLDGIHEVNGVCV